MLKILPTTAFLLLFIQSSIAQNDSIKNQDLFVGFDIGVSGSNRLLFAEEMWQKYTPNFVVPKESDGFKMTTNSHSQTYTYNLVSLGHTYSSVFLNRKKIVPSYVFVAGLGDGAFTQQTFSKQETVRYDTLTSSSTGQQYYLDSTIEKTISRSFYSRQFVVGIGNEYQTNPTKILSFRVGLNALYSFSVDRSVSVSNSTYGSTNQNGDSQSTNDTENFTTSEVSRGPSVNGFQFQLPIGIDIRLARRNPVFKSISLGLEMRPVIQWLVVDKSTTNYFSNWYGIHLRYRI